MPGVLLKKIRERQNLTQMKLAKLANVSQQIISRAELKHVLGRVAAEKLCKVLNVPLETLLLDTVISTEVTIAQHILKTPIVNWEDLLYNYQNKKRITSREAMDANTHQDCLYVPKPTSLNDDDYCVVVRINTDAMEAPIGAAKTFKDNQYVIINLDQKKFNSKDYVIAIHPETKALVFRQYIQEGGFNYLKPLNPAYETIKTNTKLAIIGKVLAVYDDAF